DPRAGWGGLARGRLVAETVAPTSPSTAAGRERRCHRAQGAGHPAQGVLAARRAWEAPQGAPAGRAGRPPRRPLLTRRDLRHRTDRVTPPRPAAARPVPAGRPGRSEAPARAVR